ncbi:uncharacterized protein [Prorops nasuta]|uniref:uncharacterized protein n=1 Tax=Prorops nasuta TaxID=863751 RepID=UPI0034CE5B5A
MERELIQIFILWNQIAENEDSNNFLLPINRESHIKINNYFENICLQYSLSDFKTHFRVTKETFEMLVEDIGSLLLENRHMNPAKQIAETLWFLGNQEVYRSVADRFGMSKDTVWNVVFNVCFALESNIRKYMKWPHRNQLLQIEERFRAICNFPGVVGAIDGTHIPISAPTQYSNSYINRKGFHSIHLQSICDHKLRFIDVYTGMCGSVNDARVWRLSDIRELINQDSQRYFPNNTHIIGDSAYPLTQYLIKPYSDNGHLNEIQINFNRKLSATRMTIERAFGILKGRFRKLKFIYMYRTDMIPLVILCCCILHNICINNDDEPFNIEEVEDDEDEDNNDYNFIDAADKRDIISRLI